MALKTCTITHASDTYTNQSVVALFNKIVSTFIKGIYFKGITERCPFARTSGETLVFDGFKTAVTLSYSSSATTGGYFLMSGSPGQTLFQINVSEYKTFDAVAKQLSVTIKYYETENSIEITEVEGATLISRTGIIWATCGTEHQFLEQNNPSTSYGITTHHTKLPSVDAYASWYDALSLELNEPTKIIMSPAFWGIDKLNGVYNIQFYSGITKPKEIEIEGLGRFTRYNGYMPYWSKTV